VQDYERFESGRVALQAVAVRLEELLAEVKEEVRWHGFQGTRLRPVLEVVSAEDTIIVGDRELLRQAFSALAAYLLRQPRTTRLLLRTSDDGTNVQVAMSCDGEALVREDRDRIFEPYVRLARRLPPAQGLGLALARAVLELHGGRVVADVGDDGGAAFLVELKSGGAKPNLHLDE
jgi:K+-sensing histidine kinase KdpD